MRIRAAKEIGIIGGIVVLLLALLFVNMQCGRLDLRDRMEKLRKRIEQERIGQGLKLLPWNLLQKTTGGVRSGPTFDPKLLPYRDTHVDIIGFMVGLDKFRNIKEFMVLPLPLECYFCQQPPMHDVVLVQMAEGEVVKSLYKEPVLINGTLTLNEGPNTKFFYVIKNARLGAGKEGGPLSPKETPQEHTLPHESKESTTMIEGHEPPKAKKDGAPEGGAVAPVPAPSAAPAAPASPTGPTGQTGQAGQTPAAEAPVDTSKGP
ncbi:MAG: DUF3299 domain-containing protein [Candidatus Hydrogenedentes bacterium]|nr:DUF3299 domain-containing protein [Candidatus Hydrogenedentota bacterium]